MQQLIDLAHELLTPDELEAIADCPLTGPGSLRQYIGGLSVEYFQLMYFSDEFTVALAPIHRTFIADIDTICERLATGKRGLKKAYIIPRGHSKSTWWSRLFPLYALLYGYSPLTVLIGSTYQSANRLLRNIEACYNEALQEDFGIPSFGIERIEYEERVIGGFSMGSGALRGMSTTKRPSLIICDDLDTDEATKSLVMLDMNREFFSKVIMALGDNVAFTTSIVVVGTLIRRTSLLQYVIDSPDFTHVIEQGVKSYASNQAVWTQWEEWFLAKARNKEQPTTIEEDTFYQEHKAEMLEGTQVLWERPDAYYTMMLFKLAHHDKAFYSEIQNTPQETDTRLGTMQVTALPTDLNEWLLFGALDPTIKGGKSNDYAAWVELLFHPKTRQMIVTYCDAKQRSYAETQDSVVQRIQASQQRYEAIIIETNSAGELIADEIERRIRGNFYLISRIHNTIPKFERIDALSQYIQSGQLQTVEDIAPILLKQLEEHPYSQHDDAADALSTIVMHVRKLGYLEVLPQQAVYQFL